MKRHFCQNTMRIYLDDETNRQTPDGYTRTFSVNATKRLIEYAELTGEPIDLLDLDHDLGEYSADGGDAIKLIDWLAETQRYYPIHIHSANIVGRENMQRTIDRYWPKNT